MKDSSLLAALSGPCAGGAGTLGASTEERREGGREREEGKKGGGERGREREGGREVGGERGRGRAVSHYANKTMYGTETSVHSSIWHSMCTIDVLKL